MNKKRKYIVYIAQCRDHSLYTGITNDLERRFREHKNGTASRYTRARKIVKIVYTEKKKNKSAALQREAEIKRMTRQKKLLLIKNGTE